MKNYKHRSFVLDIEILEKLQDYAYKKDRSLNYIVSKILKDFIESMNI